jgi:hypothetical protein
MKKDSKNSLPEIPALPPEILAQAFPNGFSIRDEANALTACAFRNGPLEDLHAGKKSPLLEDRNLSRITDAEMKLLMINASEKLANLLRMRDVKPDTYEHFIQAYAFMYCREWDRD